MSFDDFDVPFSEAVMDEDLCPDYNDCFSRMLRQQPPYCQYPLRRGRAGYCIESDIEPETEL